MLSRTFRNNKVPFRRRIPRNRAGRGDYSGADPMSLSPYLAAYYAGLTPTNANYNFAAYSNPSAAPDGWPSYSGAVTRVPGLVSANAVQVTASPGAYGGIEEFPIPAFAGPGWYVIEAGADA